MKIETDFNRRAITAEMHRRRASDLRKLVADKSLSSVRQEMEQEASWHESTANDIMDYVDARGDAVPIVRNLSIDLDQTNAPTKNGGDA